MCKGKSICRTESEIRKWLSNKYIILVYNQIVFQRDEFGQNAAKKEARLLYVPISSQLR